MKQNIPYVKRYDSNGQLLNPIPRGYQSRAFIRMDEKGNPVFLPSREDKRAMLRNSKSSKPQPNLLVFEDFVLRLIGAVKYKARNAKTRMQKESRKVNR